MSLEKSEALVLRVIPFRDTSKILTVYTEDHGLVSLLAKGVRGPKPRFGASLEIFAVIDLVFYRRDSRDLQLVSQAMLLDAHLGLAAEPRRYAYGTGLLEFLLRVLSGPEPPGKLYSLSRRTLEVLETAPRESLLAVFRAFQIKATAFLGHRPELYGCVECGQDLSANGEALFSPLRGGTVCARCVGGEDLEGARGSRVVPVLRSLLGARLSEVAERPWKDAGLTEVGRAVEAFLAAHQPGYAPLRAMRLAQSLEAST